MESNVHNDRHDLAVVRDLDLVAARGPEELLCQFPGRPRLPGRRGIRVINAATGELLRALTLDPTRDDQPIGTPKTEKPEP